MTDPACETCGSPATAFVRDLRETEPVKDAAGRLWATWEPAGDHCFCADHLRRPRREHLPGTSGWRVQELKLAEEWCEVNSRALAEYARGHP